MENNHNENGNYNGYKQLKSQLQTFKEADRESESQIHREKENSVHSVWLNHYSFRIALISMFAALSVVIGYILATIPNVELFTLSIFLGGFIIGKKEGIFIGALSSIIFVFLNPLGASPLPLLTYQVIHYSLVGFAGSFTHQYLEGKDYFNPDKDLYRPKLLVIFGFIGFTITFSYDFLTSVVDTLYFYGTIEALIPYHLSGILFTTLHEIGNTLGFIFILPGLIQLIHKLLK